jgi:hypothetical protein
VVRRWVNAKAARRRKFGLAPAQLYSGIGKAGNKCRAIQAILLAAGVLRYLLERR